MKRTFFGAIALAFTLASVGQAAVIVDTDFTAAEGFSAGNLQFQNGWIGQPFAQVDPSGTGNVVETATFTRNLFNAGANGSVAGSATDGQGSGFSAGDVVQLDYTYQFELTGGTNANLGILGFRPNFSTGGFNPSPTAGTQLFYSDFSQATGGSLKVFSTVSRNGFSGADNAFALFATGNEIGLDPSGVMGPADLVSDKVGVSYTIENQGGGVWQTTELIVSNETTNTILQTGSIDKPAALESFVYDEDELYAAMLYLRTSGPSVAVDSFRMEFTPAASNVPEPTTGLLVLVGMASLIGLRRRS